MCRRVSGIRCQQVLFCCGVLLAATGSAGVLVNTSAEDFLAGSFSDNLYASHRGGGAVEFVWRADLNGDGYIDLVCPDDSGGYARVYFGSATGYDTSACRLLPADGGGGVDIADLDNDGWPELVHSGWHSRKVVIYQGSSSGPVPDDTTALSVADKSEAVTVADIDRDGWLDIVCGVRSGLVQVFWGSASGHSSSNRTDVTVTGKIGHNLDIADLDRDGRLDIVAPAWDQRANPVIYWGQGRSVREIKYLPVTELNPHGVATADLNQDGWLDLVFGGYDTVSPAYIYYGSDSGFNITNREEITPGLCYGGCDAVDMNSDSALDLVFFRGEFPAGPAQTVLVYFNDLNRTPHFRDDDTAELGAPGFNLSGGVIADFNRDGSRDIFVDVYTDTQPSLVFWGPDFLGWDTLLSVKCHHGQAREFGNQYDRGFQEEYLSAVLGSDWPSLWHTLSWDDSAPSGCTVMLAVRTGNTREPDSTWSRWLELGNGDSIPDSLDSKFLQYRAKLGYENPAELPELFEVRVSFDSAPYHDVAPVQILSPVGAMDSGLVVRPSVRVRNLGNRLEVFPVTMEIEGGYRETIVETLAVGGIDTVFFPDWIASPAETLEVICFTALVGDTNPHNDTIGSSVIVRRPPRPDVGAVRILAPLGSVDSGTVHQPVAVVANFGELPAAFPVTFTLGDTYQATLYDSLGPGEMDTLVFPGWTAIWPGRYRLVCFTSLVNDGNRHNDTVTDTVRVKSQPVSDVGAVEILVPGLFADSGMTYQPRAVVRNYGRFDAVFPVRMRIGNWNSRAVIETLAAYRQDTVVFDPWTAQVMGQLSVRCWTELSGDPDPHNDTAVSTVIVGPPSIHDIGTAAILAPAPGCLAGETIVPWARVTNYGRRAERYFDVRFRIGTGYTRQVNVNSVLEPGASVDISFPAWVAEPGWQMVSCSTMLFGDMETGNDKKTLELFVGRNIRLHIEPDTLATVLSGESQDFWLRAYMSGDSGAVVDLSPVTAPTGWQAELLDSTGSIRLDSTLGYVSEGEFRRFRLRVRAPEQSLRGVVDSLKVLRLVVRGRIRSEPGITDSATVSLRLVPELEVHNFPNPVRRHTRFIIGLPEDGDVSLVIYNRSGEVIRRLLVDEKMKAGVSTVDWDATNEAGNKVGSGTYRYVLRYEHRDVVERLVKKLVVVRD